MTENFNVYYTQNGMGNQGFSATLRSPFYELVTNPNTIHFVDQAEKDFKPENGWELIGRNFGSPTQGINNPFFILYNKFSGTIRVFVNIRNTGNLSANVASITLSFNNLTRKTALFNQLGENTNAVNSFNNKARGNNLNSYVNSGVNDNYFWLYADYIALYDPCTCGIISDLQIRVKLVSESIITMSINNTETVLLNNTIGNSTYEENNIFKTIKQWSDFGNSLVSDTQGLFSSANSAYDKGTSLQNDANKFILNNSPFLGRENATSLAKEVGKILYEVPNVNSWLKFASTLITVVKKTSSNFDALSPDDKLKSLSNTTLTTKTTKLTASGTLSNETNQLNELIALPGSNQSGVADFRKPVYNNPLGVFNLLEQPIVKITKYLPPSQLYYQVGQFPSSYYENNSLIEVFTPINRIEILNELTPILNPSSGLKVKSIESRIEFVNREAPQNILKGPMIPGKLATFSDFGFQETSITDRESFYSNHGYNLLMFSNETSSNNKWDKAIISTPYLPQGCFSNTSLFTFSSAEKIVVKVKAILEPIINNPASDAEDVIFIFSYPAKIVNETSTVRYNITGSITNNDGTVIVSQTTGNNPPIGVNIPNIVYSPLMGLASNGYFNNMEINQDYFIIGDLTIGANVKYKPGNFTIKTTGNIYFENTPNYDNIINLPYNPADYVINYIAGNEIIISPDVIISPETNLKIDETLNLPCALTSPILQSNVSIKSYCESNDYKSRSNINKADLNDDYDLVNEFNSKNNNLDFQLFPNPSSNITTVILLENFESDVTLSVFDVMGKEQLITIRR
jgi:hypothetical protein